VHVKHDVHTRMGSTHTCAVQSPAPCTIRRARDIDSAFFPHHTPRPASSHAWGPGTIAERPFLHRAPSSAHRRSFPRRRVATTPFFSSATYAKTRKSRSA
jgi:hypothetical protein